MPLATLSARFGFGRLHGYRSLDLTNDKDNSNRGESSDNSGSFHLRILPFLPFRLLSVKLNVELYIISETMKI